MKKALNQWSVPVGTPIAELIKTAADSGYDGVEFLYREDGELGPHTPLEKVGEYKTLADQRGVEIIGFASGPLLNKYSLVHGTEEEKKKATEVVEHMFGTAKTLGAGSILCVPGFVTKDARYDVVFKRVQEFLPAVAKYAEKYDVKVCLENIWNLFILSPLEMRDLIDGAGSTHIKSYFDVGNILPFGFPEQWIRILGERIFRVHVKDYRKDIAGLKGMVNLTEGDVDWPEVMKALKEIGYDGYLTVEIFPPERLAHTAPPVHAQVLGEIMKL